MLKRRSKPSLASPQPRPEQVRGISHVASAVTRNGASRRPYALASGSTRGACPTDVPEADHSKSRYRRNWG
jgi:hypothetical protein